MSAIYRLGSLSLGCALACLYWALPLPKVMNPSVLFVLLHTLLALPLMALSLQVLPQQWGANAPGDRFAWLHLGLLLPGLLLLWLGMAGVEAVLGFALTLLNLAWWLVTRRLRALQFWTLRRRRLGTGMVVLYSVYAGTLGAGLALFSLWEPWRSLLEWAGAISWLQLPGMLVAMGLAWRWPAMNRCMSMPICDGTDVWQWRTDD